MLSSHPDRSRPLLVSLSASHSLTRPLTHILLLAKSIKCFVVTRAATATVGGNEKWPRPLENEDEDEDDDDGMGRGREIKKGRRRTAETGIVPIMDGRGSTHAAVRGKRD